jgi:membrane protease YdiL (CAAX protease family)
MYDPAMNESHSPPPLVVRRLWRVMLAWGIIIACLGWVVVGNWRNGSRPQAQGQPVAAQNIALKLSARYAVGVASLQKSSESRDRLVDTLLSQLHEQVHSPADQLRLVMIVSQLKSPAEAEIQLRTLGSSVLQPDTWQDADALRLLFRKGSAAMPKELRQRLLDHYGWYARLALTCDLPAGDPARQAAINPAIRGAVGMIVMLMGVSAAMLVGVGLLIVGLIRRLGGRRLRSAFVPTALDGGYFLEAMAIYLLGMVLLPLGVRHWWPDVGLNGTWLMAPVVALAVAWPVIRGLPWAMVRRQLGWTAGRGFWREVGAGIVGYCAALPLIVLGVVITWALSRYSKGGPSHPIIYHLAGGGWQLAGVYLLACLWAPITEETLFRGAFYQHLRGRWGWMASAIVVGLIFAVLHPQGWTAIPILGTIGIFLAVIREWRGSVIASMTAHLLINGVTVTMLALLLH